MQVITLLQSVKEQNRGSSSNLARALSIKNLRSNVNNPISVSGISTDRSNDEHRSLTNNVNIFFDEL